MNIQSLWVGRSLSTLEKLSINSFLKNGHEYHLYVYDDFEAPDGTVFKDANDIMPRKEIFYYKSGKGKGSVSAFSNIFRYELLNKKGGIWVDCDVVCVKPFDFYAEYVFASEARWDTRRLGLCLPYCLPGKIAAASHVIKCPIHSDFSEYCLKICSKKNRNDLIWGEIGPELVEQSIIENNLSEFQMPIKVFSPINYWKTEDLILKAGNIDLETYAVHLWHEIWRRRKYDTEKSYHKDSVFEKLKRMYL